MGGYGSGTWARWGAKATVEGCISLDVRYLSRHGLLTVGETCSLSWTASDGERLASVRLRVNPSVVLVTYRYRGPGGDGQDVAEHVQLTHTQCTYGRRVWFVCPGEVHGVVCGRRVAKLYLDGKYFLCRCCCDLVYQTQRMSRADRLRAMAQRIRLRLGGSRSFADPFPLKPPGTHWATYWKLRRKADDTEYHSLIALEPSLARLEAVVGTLGA